METTTNYLIKIYFKNWMREVTINSLCGLIGRVSNSALARLQTNMTYTSEEIVSMIDDQWPITRRRL
jgi:hypothetical protein